MPKTIEHDVNFIDNITISSLIATNISATNLKISGSVTMPENITLNNLFVTNTTASNISLTNLTTNSLVATGQVSLSSITTGNINSSSDVRVKGDLYVAGSVVAVNVTSVNLIQNNISTGTLLASGTSSLQNVTATNISTSTVNSGGITAGNINFTGSLYQNGALYISSQWTGTTGSLLYYGTTGSVNVGIGTTAPTNTLHVDGTMRVNTSISTPNLITTNISTGVLFASSGITTTNAIITNGATTASLGLNVVPARTFHMRGGVLRIDSSDIMISRHDSNFANVQKTFVLGVDGSASCAGNFYIGDYGNATGGAGQVRRLTINSGGNIGIGGITSSINNTLHISGSSLISEFITTPNVITTNITTDNLIINSTRGILIGPTSYGNEIFFNALDPGMAGNGYKYLTFGHTASNYNRAEVRFQWVTAGSTSNNIGLGLFGTMLMTLNGAGVVSTGQLNAVNMTTGALIASTGVTTSQLLSKASNSNGNIQLENAIGAGVLNFGDAHHSIWGRAGVRGEVDVLQLREYGQIQLWTGGLLSDQIMGLSVASSGNVGIRTSTPGYILDVLNTTSADVTHRIRCSNTGGYASTYYTNDILAWQVGVGGSSAPSTTQRNAFYIVNGATSIIGKTTGNWGVNEGTPTDTLHVAGTLRANTLITTPNIIVTNITTISVVATGNSNTVGTLYTTGGNVGINNGSPVTQLHIGNTGNYQQQMLTLYNDASQYYGFGVSASAMHYMTGQRHRWYTSSTLGSGGAGTQVMNVGSDGLYVTTLVSSANMTSLNATTSNLLVTNITTTNLRATTLITTSNITSLNGTASNLLTTVITTANLYIDSGSSATGTKIVSSNSDGAVIGFTNTAANGRTYAIGSVNGSAAGTGFSIYDSTSSQSRILIGSSGNVGIGTTSPVHALEIIGGVSNSNRPFIRIGNTSGGSGNQVGIMLSPFTGASRTGGSAQIIGIDDGSAAAHLTFWTAPSGSNTPSVERVRITNSGNVGIGTNNPGEILDVRGNLRVGGSTQANYIAFYGLNGDGAGSWNHSYIGERIWGGTENSELLLYKGNDAAGAAGPDRIRLLATELRFDTNSGIAGTFDGVATTGTTRMIIDTLGNIGIGTTSPSGLLHLNNAALFTSTGNLTCVGDVVAFGNLSDERLKKNIKSIDIQKSIDVIKNIRGVTFDWEDNIFNEAKRNTSDIGFIAQEIEKFIPEAVSDYTEIKTGEVYKNIKYERIVPHLLTVIQYLLTKIDQAF